MEVQLASWLQGSAAGQRAQEILRRCVHCGFCTATCPTYQLLGDELDGPRGRIYLMKELVEGGAVGRATQVHLDRCLTCRNCETTCPSGVQYGELIDIGRELIEERVKRPLSEAWTRGVLRWFLPSVFFAPAYRLGLLFRPLLPKAIASKLIVSRKPRPLPPKGHGKKVIMLRGCVQPSMLPNVDVATARVLAAIGLEARWEEGSGCCGAVRQHLADPHGALNDARRNIDAWWPSIAAGEVEAVMVNASGCAVMVKDYGRLLAEDPAYAERAAAVSRLAVDPIECLEPHMETIRQKLLKKGVNDAAIAYHPPCTQQHGMQIRGRVETFLRSIGASLVSFGDGHLCCGSAGTYSVLQPDIAKALRDRKLSAIQAARPDLILSANVGCISHLASDARVPVMHWLEWLDDQLTQD